MISPKNEILIIVSFSKSSVIMNNITLLKY